MEGTIFDIQRNSFVDGPGIRTTVFFKGCNLRCKWCHNPESQRAEKQILFYQNKCIGCGKCQDMTVKDTDFFCPADAKEICGKKMLAEDVMKEIVKDKAFYEASGGGVTFSGGECMLQIGFLSQLLNLCKEEGIHTAVDTAGHLPWNYFEEIMDNTDLFLYDMKCFSSELHQKGTGVFNELILENLQRLAKIFPEKILVRIPVIGGFNDDEEEMEQMANYLKSIGINQVELLPYHKMGEHKYRGLDMEYREFQVPTPEEMSRYREMF